MKLKFTVRSFISLITVLLFIVLVVMLIYDYQYYTEFSICFYTFMLVQSIFMIRKNIKDKKEKDKEQ